MTVSPDTPPLRFDDLQGALTALRELGLRISTARRLILEALFSAEGPVSALHLAETLLIEESSVYRNLEVLESRGVIRHVHLGHGPGLYVLLGHGEAEYLYCDVCSRVTEVPATRLDGVREQIRAVAGYETRFTHFAIVGVCETCAAQAGDDSRTDVSRRDAEAHSHGDFVHTHHRTDTARLAHRR